MAKVEMSLAEYNAMKEELDLYKRILNELTTPHVDEWWIERSKETGNDICLNSRYVGEISTEVYNVLKDLVLWNMPEELKVLGTLEISRGMRLTDLGTIIQPKETDSEEEVSNG